MTKESIFEVIKENLLDIVPDIEDKQVTIEESLKNLGANSIDRMEILIQTMEDINIKIPMLELSKVKNIKGLVDILYQEKSGDI